MPFTYNDFDLKKKIVGTKIEHIAGTQYVVISPDIHIIQGRRGLSLSLEHPLLFSMAQPVVNFSHM